MLINYCGRCQRGSCEPERVDLMAAEFHVHVFPHVAVFLLLSTVVGEGDVSRKGELRIMWKERTGKPHPNPKPTKDCRRWSILST